MFFLYALCCSHKDEENVVCRSLSGRYGGSGYMYIYRQTDTHSSFQGTMVCFSFPGGSNGKKSACNSGALSLIPGLGRSPGEGNGYPLQYSCLENPMDRGAWWATVPGVAKNWTRVTN